MTKSIFILTLLESGVVDMQLLGAYKTHDAANKAALKKYINNYDLEQEEGEDNDDFIERCQTSMDEDGDWMIEIQEVELYC